MVAKVPIEKRFWKYVQRGPGCWEWTGAKSGGYGTVRADGRVVKAHRWAYESLVGPIPDGYQIDHLCRNTGCVNPEHLEAVTQRENILRGIGPTAVNAAKERCSRNHDPNWYVKASGVRQCRECRKLSVQKYKARLRRERLK